MRTIIISGLVFAGCFHEVERCGTSPTHKRPLGASAETGWHQTLSCAVDATSTKHDSFRINGKRCANDLLKG